MSSDKGDTKMQSFATAADVADYCKKEDKKLVIY